MQILRVSFFLGVRICVLVPSKIKSSRANLSASSALKLVQIRVLVPSAYSGVLFGYSWTEFQMVIDSVKCIGWIEQDHVRLGRLCRNVC